MEDFTEYQDVNVNEVFREGVWDWTILIPQPNDYIKEIIARCPITINQDKEAIPVWMVTESGAFMVSSAWESMTPRSESSEHLFCTGQYAQRIWQIFYLQLTHNNNVASSPYYGMFIFS
ncbi:hypothetical protein MTR67_038197 [Solanum verrucosum]|uniref:Uncharacterized protein n=1 Tax=Solanum verrucosum TaxID=315347 RepID=A0AAF0UF23_SOLVR|nr:hypothetical protein MTR67_038197 [Solanum verrucosum]